MKSEVLGLSLVLLVLCTSAHGDASSSLERLTREPPQPDILVLKKLDALIDPAREIGSVHLTAKATNGLPKFDRLALDRVPSMINGLEIVVSFSR